MISETTSRFNKLLKSIELNNTEEATNIINNTNEENGLALISACYYYRPEIASLLISVGADIHMVSDSGDTALIWACWYSKSNPVFLDIAKTLLRKGSDPTAKNSTNLTPLTATQSPELKSLIIAKIKETQSKPKKPFKSRGGRHISKKSRKTHRKTKRSKYN